MPSSRKTRRQALKPAQPQLSRAERAKAGQALRERVARSAQGEWKVERSQRDPLTILEKSNVGRLLELVPIRFGRMLRSPFTFLRGSAAVMAHDLAKTPHTGLQVQACGDCHLMNFGLFATPERRLVFDINDFDETHHAPWEWDLKRLAASFAVAGRDGHMSDQQIKDCVRECTRSYRVHVRECAELSPLDVWYQNLDMQTLIERAPDAAARKFRERLAEKARRRIIDHLFPKIAAQDSGQYRLVDQPPVLYHVGDTDFEERARQGLAVYRESMSDERRVLLDRYRLEDVALKVVGIGSVGTRCYIALMISDEGHPLILQFKEAVHSVLEPYTSKGAYDNQGQRVVMGQRLMQSSSDIFLGWARGRNGKDFYVRQLRDMKMSVPVEELSGMRLKRYARACGWSLARAHAKSGDAATISGYLGRGDNFDRALVKFAIAYADQTERDHATLVKAARAGRIETLVEEQE